VALSQPIGRFNHNGMWELSHRWECKLSDGRTLVVQDGFESDGASIPRLLWPAVGPRFNPRTFVAAFAHDALYASKLTTRKFADDEFLHMLKLLRFRLPYAYWLGVRVGGWAAWRGHKGFSVERARLYVSLV
jgi:hypothetical protein